jgi:DNA-directed RNA polymerase specialized sigma24 family protein
VIFPDKQQEAAGRSRSVKRQEVWRIEGEAVNYSQIAKRLRITIDCARSRMHSLRSATGAITWARLEAIGK